MAPDTGSALSIRDLTVEFDTPAGVVRAADGVSYDVAAGETLGVVGETGSGKSVTALAALGLLSAGNVRRVAGQALLGGTDLLALPADELRAVLGREVAMIFQDPGSALNPVQRVGDQIAEALRVHDRTLSAPAARARTVELLDEVGVPNPAGRYDAYPHQFSGGMCQRAVIAMAIANRPRVLIADEPTTALDVSVQAQILDVLRRAARETGAATVLITHDLGVVAETADRLCVMYGGRVVESGTVYDVFARPRHPYTAALLASLPRLDVRADRLTPIPGRPPDLIEVTPGCAFAPRCPVGHDRPRCAQERPEPVATDGGLSACHYPDEAGPPPRAAGPERDPAPRDAGAAGGGAGSQGMASSRPGEPEKSALGPGGGEHPPTALPRGAGAGAGGPASDVGASAAGSRPAHGASGTAVDGLQETASPARGATEESADPPPAAPPHGAAAKPAVPAAGAGASASPPAPGAPGTSSASPRSAAAKSGTPPDGGSAPRGAPLDVRDARKLFPLRTGVFARTSGYVHAVDGVSLRIPAGRTLGLVGESGCGKSTLARMLLRLVEPSGGELTVAGHDLVRAGRGELRRIRQRVQMVYQDPFASLNPRLSVGDNVAEPLRLAGGFSRPQRRDRVLDLFDRVGLRPEHADRYPAEFSGGQRQRVAIARALALRPRLLLLDEPVSALDVSVQAQVLNLLADLQQESGMAYLFVSHDLSVVRQVADEVAVMYLGRIVESGPVERIYGRPRHPYTRALLDSVPAPDPVGRETRRRAPLGGDVPSPADPPSGCRFRTRCPLAEERCAAEEPALRAVDGGLTACHFAETLRGAGAPRAAGPVLREVHS
ncbi:dipeptide ABC transporter ATP-binding protein [Streptomyces sp. B5E4]|uniref:dipeptide ABC transporter ATP-binding protein n=1 Tax=Streptomyces sp. B5E4 TaxID=3153568 RepID=UPI00325E0CB8